MFERVVGHVPSWEEFESGFQPGVRFFFREKDLKACPGLTFDGFHTKIRDEVALDPCLVLVVVPQGLPGSDKLMETAQRMLPEDKVISLSFEGLHYRIT